MQKRIVSPKAYFTFFASLLLLFGLLIPKAADASHFRYGSISWIKTGTNTVKFKISMGWRLSSHSITNVGDSSQVDAPFYFGDGNGTYFYLKATTINNSEDWFYGEAEVTHTYAGTGPYEAYFYSCCRISSLTNNPDGSELVSTIVDLSGSNNGSPILTIPPIVNIPYNVNATYQVAYSDPDNDSVTFRLSTYSESYNYNPSGLSISSGGLISWNTSSTSIGQLYSVSITGEDDDSKTMGDFIIRIVAGGNAPVWDYTETPANNSTIYGTINTALSFDLEAYDLDSPEIVTLSGIGLPVGSSFSQTSGDPATGSFSWTPTSAGTYVLSFIAEDDDFNQTNTSVTINVSACSVEADAGTDQTVYYGYAPMACASLTATGDSSTATYLWSTSDTTATITACPTTTTTYWVVISESSTCFDTAWVTVNVVDVRCGKNMNKVSICHNGNSLCISSNAIADHLTDHDDDYLGNCTSLSPYGSFGGNQNASNYDMLNEINLAVYPNPFTNTATIEFGVNTDQRIALEIYDIKGQLVKTIYTGNAAGGALNKINFDANELKANVYFVRLSTATDVQHLKLFLIK